MIEELRRKFSVALPLFLAADKDAIKLELKPYLQPFERELAIRELKALLDPEDEIKVEHGLHVVCTEKSDDFLRQHLTYWQRVGRIQLEPTLQKSLELTQNGLPDASERRELHRARRLRYGPHDLHEYRGKFFPQLVRSLINIAGVGPDAIILDPMCGSGTTPCEAIAAGRSAIGADLNPLSVLIARVKASVPLEQADLFAATTKSYLEAFRFESVSPHLIWNDDDLRYLKLWFADVAIQEIASILVAVRAIEHSLYRDFFSICLSNIIRSVSWQKQTDLRVRKEVQPYDAGTAIKRFTLEAEQQIDRIFAYLSVLPHHDPRPRLEIRHGNSVEVAALFSEYVNKIDLLITSPPYATALPYLDTDRLSLICLGLLPRKRHKGTETNMIGTREVTEKARREMWEKYVSRRDELPSEVADLVDTIAMHNHADDIGFRRRNLPALLGKYFLDMIDAMRSARTLMKPGAHGYYVVGNNSTVVDGQKLEIPTHRFLASVGVAAGWKYREEIPMELLASRDIFRENRGSSETILCFTA
ncbi:hypothetical protein AAII07_35680 [Microvirga sp. 0TCS3.31]